MCAYKYTHICRYVHIDTYICIHTYIVEFILGRMLRNFKKLATENLHLTVFLFHSIYFY